MKYKIVVDSCCELKEEYKNDPRFAIVPLSIQVGDYNIMDDENFNQAELLDKLADSSAAPKSACPAPGAYLDAFECDAEDIFVVTLSSELSGSYNSAVVAMEMYEEEHGPSNIHIIDSESASCGELQIVEELIKLEEKGLEFDEIVGRIEVFRNGMKTYFVLNTLDTFKKTGRLKGLKSLLVSSLNIKPVLQGVKGNIAQLDQGIGMRKALSKMVDHIVKGLKGRTDKILMISHCNAPERAEQVKEMILRHAQFARVIIVNMRGISTMYANDGGIIVTV